MQRQIGARSGERHEAAEVRLDEIAAVVGAEADVPAKPRDVAQCATGRSVLGTGDRHQRLEETTLVPRRRREVHGESAIGALEATVHEPVAHRLVTPLVDVDVRRVEQEITRSPIRGPQIHASLLPLVDGAPPTCATCSDPARDCQSSARLVPCVPPRLPSSTFDDGSVECARERLAVTWVVSGCRGSRRWASSRPRTRAVARSGRRLRSAWMAQHQRRAATPCVRCMRCARASRRRTSASSSLAVRVLDELDELGVGVRRVRTVARAARPGRRGRRRRSAAPISSTRLRWLATRPSPTQLVVVEEAGRSRGAEALDQVPVAPARGGSAARPGSRPVRAGSPRISAIDLERPAGAVHVPREVRDPVGPAQRIGQRRARPRSPRARCTGRCGTRRRRDR